MADRATVLQLSTMVPPARFGGAERVVASFGEQLTGAGFRVINEGLRARDEPGPGLPIPNLYWPFDGRQRRGPLRLAWHTIDAVSLSAHTIVAHLVDTTRPDVIVTHNLRGWGLAPWAVAHQRRIPLAHVVHDYGLLCNTSTLWHGGADCGRLCRVRRATAVRRWSGGLLIGVSAAVLDEHHRRGFGGAAPHAVIHPVAAAQRSAPGLRRRGGGGVPQTLGYLGRLTEEKGIGTLIDAVAGMDRRLIVAGEGAEADVTQLKRRAGAGVDFRGWMQPDRLFDEIDALVVPSLWREPFGLVVAEAAGAGVPVLLADQPGLVEAAQTAGARHSLFTAGDVGSLRSALTTRLESYRLGAPGSAPDADIVELIGRLACGARR